MFRSYAVAAVLVTFGSLAGCSSGGEDFGTSASEIQLTSIRPLGPLQNGERKNGIYTSSPTHRSFDFDAKGGDEITFDARLVDGDVIAFITDEQNNVLAENDNASGGTADARVKLKVPAGTPESTFHAMFRAADGNDATFGVKVSVLRGAPKCTVAGSSYGVGQKFMAADRCNTCECTANGTPSCTTQQCACNPTSETGWRRYLGTPQACLGLHVTCFPGERPFANGCGCGCELLD